jgi:hypothetical protein
MRKELRFRKGDFSTVGVLILEAQQLSSAYADAPHEVAAQTTAATSTPGTSAARNRLSNGT